ncbi:UPF0193 protein EVG1 isoform X1 [Amphiprion ocellaris]|uniref:UPF0193 protein EVG1 isoform X1 n=1 Tax=Amphiprion ocellaris TaxID=80972 RepID=UPI0024111793|nr:UPF0193 protein EVG1 isoform X1 [Amphiprion ocellaris]
METSSQSTAGRGLWNNPRVTQCSREAQNMLKLMKEESRLANIQRREIDKCPKNRAALPFTSDATPSSTSSKSIQKQLPGICQKRSAECCRSGNSYTREKFRPGPTRDLEKEKKRLQNILATGKEEASAASPHKAPACRDPEVSEEEDRYEEVLNEIEERRQFLADMASLGQEKNYIDIINTEISQVNNVFPAALFENVFFLPLTC